MAATGSLRVSDRNFRFGPFELSEREGELRKNGVRIKLQEQPFQVLHELVANAGKVVSREDLQQRLWPADTFVDFNVGVNTAIRKLRLALNDDADKPRYIETLSKRGYRFIAEVTIQQAIIPALLTENSSGSVSLPPIVVVAPTRAGSGTGIAEVIEEADAAAAEDATERPRVGRRKAILAAVAALLAIAGCFLYFAMRPYPVPHVKEYKQLTFDGGSKYVVGIDGARLYLMLVTSEYTGMAELSTTGGELRKVPLLPGQEAFPLQISADGTQLLFIDPRPPHATAPLSPFYSVPILGGAPRRLGDIKGLWASWSSDRSLLAYNSIDTIYLANGDGTGPRKVITISPPEGLFTWVLSPDGRIIRFVKQPQVGQPARLWEINSDGSGLHRFLPSLSGGDDWGAGGWSPDGHYFYFNFKDQIWVQPEKRSFLARTPEPVQLTSGPTLLGANALFGPDNRVMYAVGYSRQGELERYDLETGLSAPALGGLSAEYVAFSPDLRWVAYVTYPQGVLWRSRVDGSERLQLTNPPGYVIVPRWSPDNKTIYYQADFDLQEKLFQVSVDGGEPKPILPDEKRHLSDPNPSPDGRKLAISRCEDPACVDPKATTAIDILDLVTGQVSVVPGSQDRFFSVRWSPDGRYLASISNDATKLFLYDLQTQTWAQVDKGNHLGWQAFSHDGRFLYYMEAGLIPSICRLRVSDHHVDRFPVKNLTGTGHWGLALSLGPDDVPLLLRDKTTSDLYALELEWK